MVSSLVDEGGIFIGTTIQTHIFVKRQGIENHELKAFTDPSIIPILFILGSLQHGLQVHGILDDIPVVGSHLFRDRNGKQSHFVLFVQELYDILAALTTTDAAQKFGAIYGMVSVRREIVVIFRDSRTACMDPNLARVANQHFHFFVAPFFSLSMICGGRESENVQQSNSESLRLEKDDASGAWSFLELLL